MFFRQKIKMTLCAAQKTFSKHTARPESNFRLHNMISGAQRITFRINKLMLWETPFRIILYAVSLGFEQMPFNSVTKALNNLRNCAYYSEIHQDFIDIAIRPIVEVFSATNPADKSDVNPAPYNYDWLVESGNKFKVFQIIQAKDGIEPGDEDLFLYDAGTLAKHVPLSTGINSPEYIKNILDEHKISVFSGWRGLALLDTFTLITTDTPEYVLRNWEKDYFEKNNIKCNIDL